MFESGSNGRSPSIDWMELMNVAANFVFLNLLFVFGSLLVVTIPAMTAALFAVIAPPVRGQLSDPPLAAFWRATRRYWRNATIVGVIDLVVAGSVALNLLILWQTGFEQFFAVPALVITILLGGLLALVNVYIWPLLVTLDQPPRSLLKNGLRLAIAHPLWGFLLVIMALLLFVISLFLPRILFLIFTFSAVALVTYWGAWQKIERYLDEEDWLALGMDPPNKHIADE